jgi:hypothetical protein
MSRPPFPFIVGCGRSGTTFLRAMLDTHPEMAIPPENHFLMRLAEAWGRMERRGGIAEDALVDLLAREATFELWDLPIEDVRAELRSGPPQTLAAAIRALYGLYAASRGKPRYGDKTPMFVRHLPYLGATFPEARFVHLLRDGRDVACSSLARGVGPRTVPEAAVWWRREVLRGRRGSRHLDPGRYLEVRYEDLVADPPAQLRTICRFLDLEYDEAMLGYHERSDIVPDRRKLRRIHSNLRRPPIPNLRDWRSEMSPREVELFEALAGDLLSYLGYERRVPHPQLKARARARARWAGVHAGRLRHRAYRLLAGVR